MDVWSGRTDEQGHGQTKSKPGDNDRAEWGQQRGYIRGTDFLHYFVSIHSAINQAILQVNTSAFYRVYGFLFPMYPLCSPPKNSKLPDRVPLAELHRAVLFSCGHCPYLALLNCPDLCSSFLLIFPSLGACGNSF